MKRRIPTSQQVGKKFGLLTVVEIVPNESKYAKVKCVCECGGTIIAFMHNIKRGFTSSCGCMLTENAYKQLEKANHNNPNFKKAREPRIGTALNVYSVRYEDGDLTFEQFLELSQQNCFYCGIPPSNITNTYKGKRSKYSKERQENGYFVYNGLDRVDNSKPHNYNNVVPCCLRCNKAKLNQSLENFFKWIKIVYNKHCI